MHNNSKSRPRTKPPEVRRDELITAARSLFLRHGVGPTTIEQITSGADVAKGTFYLYFSSKDDILSALRERFAQTILTKIKTAIAKRREEDWKGKLEAWAAAGTSGYLGANRLHDVLFYASHPRSRKGLVNNIVIDHLAELLQAGAKAGAWTIEDARSTSVFLFSGLHGLVDAAHNHQNAVVRRVGLTRTLTRLCFRALGLAPR
ncbi:MAG TPA: TetR/AcrR family transcriptional regulator [Candidatus Acidoferrales bacterium]|nr:TetR/AcrR family transcriptional regulator [Candidatus Acidoferrales bacterium]